MKRLPLRLFSGLKEFRYWPRYIMLFKNWPIYIFDWLGIIKKGKHTTYRLRNGILLRVRAASTDRIAISNILIKNAFMLHTNDIKNSHTVIDIGAHIGSFSIFIASLAKNVNVYAYEPEPSNYELLVENIKLNRLEDRVFPFNYAVSDSRGVVKLYLSDESTGHSTFLPFPKFIEVPSLSLRDIFTDNSIQKCDILKINAEGAEYPILLSASEQTLSRIRTICVQCHNIDREKNISALERFLLRNNFRVVRKGEFIKATNESTI